MKKIRFGIVAVLLLTLSCLAACTAAPQPARVVEPTQTPAPQQSAAPVAAVPTATPVDEVREAYCAALDDLLNRHVLPDMSNIWEDGFDEYGSTQFAITDIDGDGKDELIFISIGASMAGQLQCIYGYDETTKQLKQEFSEFPALTFYANGVIKAEWSHNQGLAGDFWPYTLYRYDPATDTYPCVGMVDAWDKSFAQKDFEGNAFPDEIDVSATGVVYYLIEGSEYRQVEPVDVEAYKTWRDGILGDAAEVKIEYAELTQEAIDALR